MIRVLLTAAVLCAPTLALAQDTEVSAEIEVRGIFDDNAALASTSPESLFVLAVSPSAQIEAPLRYVDVLARYRLTYFNYTSEGIVTRAPDFAHDGHVRVALTVWEGVDLAVSDSLQSIGSAYGLPRDAPENLVLRNTGSARFGLRFDLDRATSLRVSYDADRVDYLDDVTLPPFLLHGPALTFERELSRDVTAGLEYAFRLQDFDEEGQNNQGASPHGDFQSHNALVHVRYAGSRWNAVRFRGGYQHITASEDTIDPVQSFLAELGVDLNPTEFLGFAINGVSQFTVDIDGTPAQRTEAQLVASLVPMGVFTILVEGAYGQLLVTPDTSPNTDRTYTRASLTLDYEVMQYARARAGYIYHASSTDIGDVDVNRVFVSLAGQFK